MKARYFKGLFKTHSMKVLSLEKVSGDYVLVRMQAAYPLKWEAGQHGAFTLPGEKFKGKSYRAFSIASPPSEETMLIGTKLGKPVSAFKQALMGMQEGEIIRLRGPFGWFVVQDDTSPIVLIATGIGITVMRSLLYALKDETSRPIHLIHSAKGLPLFSDEFKQLSDKNKQIKLTFVSEREEFKQALTAVAFSFGSSAYYYVSGTFEAIRSTRSFLKSLKVKGKRIIYDPFFGY
ncbi:MAG TPA: FAD-dependent oxidoreductase [Sphaerochaeta sp.]|nr:FAD-dependent oxidoreductase [Sphaerochaeta sp.]